MDKETHFNVWYFIAAILLILGFQQWMMTANQGQTIPYSEFEDQLQAGAFSRVEVSGQTVRGELGTPRADGTRYLRANRVDPDMAQDLARYNVEYTGVAESGGIGNVLGWLLPFLIFFGLWFFLIRGMVERQGMGGYMSVGKSKAKVAVEKDIGVTFDDVAGVDEAKDELKEIVAFLKDPSGYGRLGARIPKGVLLVGPPGTGKTLLARAVAGEAGVKFFSINGSEFVEMFVGVGASRVRDLFEQARKSAPCIIFIDELDALGRARGISPVSGGTDEKEQTLNQLLAELDGFDPSTGVVLLSATNRPEILDPALLRAGRFDRQILVDRPDRTGREQILKVHIRKVKHLADDVEIDQLAALTPGFTGADIANLVNEAALLATRRDGTDVTMDDFNRAIERIVAGLEKKSRILNPKERKIVAYHEMGHALVAKALPGVDVVHKVSIIPRGVGALGYNIQRPTEDRYLMTRHELENKMAGLLGGRAAEMLVFGELSTGAADDLDRATDIARGMVMRYGMDERLGQATYAQHQPLFLDGQRVPSPAEARSYSEKTAAEIDEAVKTLLAAAFDTATAILNKNRALLDDTATRLLEKETLSADELPGVEAWGEG